MNIYVDCGFYMGMALQKYLDKGIITKAWKIYAFEPNPDLATEKKIDDFFSELDIELIPKAVWTEDGEVPFHISGREDAAGIADLTGHTEPKEVIVPSIDFSSFLSKLPDAYVLCSMDIEGAEFVVLEKLLADGTIDRINHLDIEFHHRFMNDYTEKEAEALIKRIEERGVTVELKVELV